MAGERGFRAVPDQGQVLIVAKKSRPLRSDGSLQRVLARRPGARSARRALGAARRIRRARSDTGGSSATASSFANLPRAGSDVHSERRCTTRGTNQRLPPRIANRGRRWLDRWNLRASRTACPSAAIATVRRGGPPRPPNALRP